MGPGVPNPQAWPVSALLRCVSAINWPTEEVQTSSLLKMRVSPPLPAMGSFEFSQHSSAQRHSTG
jgi:hypothetical protein